MLSWSLKGELEFWMYSGTLDPPFSAYAWHIIIHFKGTFEQVEFFVNNCSSY